MWVFKDYKVMHIEVAGTMLTALMKKILCYENYSDLSMTSYLCKHVVKVLLLSRLAKQVVNDHHIAFLRLTLPTLFKALEYFYVFQRFKLLLSVTEFTLGVPISQYTCLVGSLKQF